MERYIIVAAFVAFDIITGLIKAAKKGTLNSTALRRGMYSKLSEFIAVAGSGLMEYGFNYFHYTAIPLMSGVTTYICIMELISILENLAEINPNLEKLFRPYLEKIQKLDIEEKGEGKDEFDYKGD